MSKISTMLNNWKTTLAGVLPFIFALLNQFKIIEVMPEQATEATNGAIDAIVTAITSVLFVIGLFSRDADRSSEQKEKE